MRRVNLVLVGIASIALLLMFRKIDWPSLTNSLMLAKWYWALLVVPYGITCYFWTLSWRLLLVRCRLRSSKSLFSSSATLRSAAVTEPGVSKNSFARSAKT